MAAVVKESDDRELRRITANGFRDYVLENEARIAAVRTLAAEVEDQELRDVLQEALKPGVKRPRPPEPKPRPR